MFVLYEGHRSAVVVFRRDGCQIRKRAVNKLSLITDKGWNCSLEFRLRERKHLIVKKKY